MDGLAWRLLLLTGGMSLKAQGCQSAGFFDAALFVDSTQSSENSRKSDSDKLRNTSAHAAAPSVVSAAPLSFPQALLSVLTLKRPPCPLSQFPPPTAAEHGCPNNPRLKPANPPLPTQNLHVTSARQHSTSLLTGEHKCLSEVLNSGAIPTEPQWWEGDSCALLQLLWWVILI